MPLLSCPDALALLARTMLSLWQERKTERVLLHAARGRVLASAITSDRDQPPFPRSTRDGYAVRAEDAGSAFEVVGSLRAGEQWTGPRLGAEQALEIMTGAPLPNGADAVVMVEHVRLAGKALRLMEGRSIRSGENVVPQGAEARAGEVLLEPGVRLGPAEIALAVAVGAAEVEVSARPVAAILATGDELVPLDAVPGPAQIRNSNAHALAALVEEAGGTPLMLRPAADTRESLSAAIPKARDAEMLLLSGGVSAGKYDLVEEVLLGMGAEFFFTGVAMQPGKPVVFGRLPGDGSRREQWIFGLPGNPVSTQVTATLFAMPLLRALGGEVGDSRSEQGVPQPSFALARLEEEVQIKPGLTRFLPAVLSCGIQGATVRMTGWQGSGDLHANARANCYLVVPEEVERMEAGLPATVLLR